jgi:MFS family permease
VTGRRGLAPLRHRGFRLLVGGQFTSGAGDACYAVALPWYVLAAHGGALLLGTVLAAYGIARTAAIVAGGQASDRWRPWTVMMASDAVRAVAVGAMAAAAATGSARAAVLVPIAVVLGAGGGFFLPGSFAIIPTLLPGDELQAGNSLGEVATQLATVGGPVLGGALVAIAGPAPAFALDAVTFVVSAVTLAGIRASQRAGAAVSAEPADAVEPGASPAAAVTPDAVEDSGSPTVWGVLRSSPVLPVILLVVVAANLGTAGTFEVALPALARGPLHAGAGGYGALTAAFAVGALAGALLAGQLGGVRRPALLGSAAFLVAAVLIGVVPYAGGTAAVGVVMAGFGVMNGLGNIVMLTLFQRWSPPALLGRLTALIMLGAFGLFPLSALLGAVVVHSFGPAPFFVIAAALLAAAIAGGLTQRSWRDLGRVSEPGTPVRGSAEPSGASGAF